MPYPDDDSNFSLKVGFALCFLFSCSSCLLELLHIRCPCVGDWLTWRKDLSAVADIECWFLFSVFIPILNFT